jgi:hypothetical protein
MQLRGKHDFSTVEMLCFLRDPFNVVIKKRSVWKTWSSFETPACQDMSLGTDELN